MQTSILPPIHHLSPGRTAFLLGAFLFGGLAASRADTAAVVTAASTLLSASTAQTSPYALTTGVSTAYSLASDKKWTNLPGSPPDILRELTLDQPSSQGGQPLRATHRPGLRRARRVQGTLNDPADEANANSRSLRAVSRPSATRSPAYPPPRSITSSARRAATSRTPPSATIISPSRTSPTSATKRNASPRPTRWRLTTPCLISPPTSSPPPTRVSTARVFSS